MGTHALTKRKYLNGGVGGCIGNRGMGKTMAVTFLALIELMLDPALHIYANFKIKHPRAHYVPFLFLPFEKMKNCILIIDDASKIENIERYTKVISNISRKLFMDIIFTGQAQKHIPKAIRGQLNYKIYPFLNEKKTFLSIKIVYEGGEIKYHNISYPIGKVKALKFYNTREVPPFVMRTDAVREIAKISNTPYEIERNLMLYTGDKKEVVKMKKEILSHRAYKGRKQVDEPNEKQIQPNKKNQMIAYLKFLGFTHREVAYILNNDKADVSTFKRKLGNQFYNVYKADPSIEEDKRLWILKNLIEKCNLKKILPSNIKKLNKKMN